MLSAFINVSGRPFANNTCDAADLCTERKVTSPCGRLDTRALLHHDDVSGTCDFDRGRTEMLRTCRPPIVDAEFDGDDAARNFALSRELMNARHDTAYADLVHCIGDRAGIEPIQ